MKPDQERAEQHHREAEGAMDVLVSAAKALDGSAESLREDDAPSHLIEAIETAAKSVRAEHKRLMKSVYWQAPQDGERQLHPSSTVCRHIRPHLNP